MGTVIILLLEQFIEIPFKNAKGVIMTNTFFHFQKNKKISFQKRVESRDQIVMPNMAKETMCVVDETPTGYEDSRWIEKSNSIKARDNYTCQLCHAFNPMQEGLVFVQQGKYETYHQYIADRSSYIIHVNEYNFTINIDFNSGFHLAMPRLNVHHKVYYRNRMLWDYPDDCLVTLCEDCHHYIHSLNDIVIPIVEENPDGQAILIGKTKPKPYLFRLEHTDLGSFQPLSLVKENRWGTGLKGREAADYELAKRNNKKWYDYHEILDNRVVQIRTFKCYDPQWNKQSPEEIEKVADFIIHNYIENILGFRNN